MEQEVTLEGIIQKARTMRAEHKATKKILADYDEKYTAMLNQAQTEIERFFKELLRISPFMKIRLNVNAKFTNNITLLVENNLFCNTDQVAYNNEVFRAIVFETGYSGLYVFPSKWAKCTYNGVSLKAFDEADWLLLAEDFDNLKQTTMNRMSTEIDRAVARYNDTTNAKKKDLETLKHFLDSRIIEQQEG